MAKTKTFNMKKLSVIAVAIVLCMFGIFWLGGFLSGKGEPAETKWKGESLELAKIPHRLPEWRVLVVWEKAPAHAREGADYCGPFPHYIMSKKMPTLESIRDVLPPIELPGTWTPCLIFGAPELIDEGYPPLSDTPKEHPEKPIKEQL